MINLTKSRVTEILDKFLLQSFNKIAVSSWFD